MEKKSNVMTKLIISFFLVSILIFLGAYVYFSVVKFSAIKFSAADNKIDFTRIEFLASLLYFIQTIPFILIASLNITYSGYINSNTTIKYLFIMPLLFALSIIMMYGFYMTYYISPLYNEVDKELSKIEYAKLVDYRKELKTESMNMAMNSLMSNDIDLAYKYLSDARFYSPDDNDINIILKTIDHNKKQQEEHTERYELKNINDRIEPAVKAYSENKLKQAHKLFLNVLEIEPDNKLAIYYINKINMLDKNLPLYKGVKTDDIYLYDKLSDAISSYENKNYWDAYKKISDLYKIKSADLEIRKYYYLIIDAIREYDFFIEDSEKIEEMYINKEIDDRFRSKNGFNILLNEDTLLNIGSGLYYNSQFYIFDISLIDINSSINDMSYSRFKYGKILDTIDNENKNKKTFILKGRFNKNNTVYSKDNKESFTNISVIMSDNTLYSLRTKNYLKPEYISIESMYKLRDEMPKLGYNLYNIDNEIIKKILDIIYLITLSLVVVYYSYKYRSMKDKRKHFIHSFIGIAGVLFILLFIKVKLLTIVDYLLTITGIYNVTIIMIVPAVIIFIIYFVKIFKTKTNV